MEPQKPRKLVEEPLLGSMLIGRGIGEQSDVDMPVMLLKQLFSVTEHGFATFSQRPSFHTCGVPLASLLNNRKRGLPPPHTHIMLELHRFVPPENWKALLQEIGSKGNSLRQLP